MKSIDYPNKNYTLNAYLYSGGATMDWALRVELVNNSNNKTKNIYWKYHDNDADMEWLNNETVIINGKKLNIHKDKYDFRID